MALLPVWFPVLLLTLPAVSVFNAWRIPYGELYTKKENCDPFCTGMNLVRPTACDQLQGYDDKKTCRDLCESDGHDVCDCGKDSKGALTIGFEDWKVRSCEEFCHELYFPKGIHRTKKNFDLSTEKMRHCVQMCLQAGAEEKNEYTSDNIKEGMELALICPIEAIEGPGPWVVGAQVALVVVFIVFLALAVVFIVLLALAVVFIVFLALVVVHIVILVVLVTQKIWGIRVQPIIEPPMGQEEQGPPTPAPWG